MRDEGLLAALPHCWTLLGLVLTLRWRQVRLETRQVNRMAGL